MKHELQENLFSWLAEGKGMVGLLPAILISWSMTKGTYRWINEAIFRPEIVNLVQPARLPVNAAIKKQALRYYSEYALAAAGVLDKGVEQRLEVEEFCRWINLLDAVPALVQSTRIFWKVPAKMDPSIGSAADDLAKASTVDIIHRIIPQALVQSAGDVDTVDHELSEQLRNGIVGEPTTFCVLHLVASTGKEQDGQNFARIYAKFYAVQLRLSGGNITNYFVKRADETIPVLEWPSPGQAFPSLQLMPITAKQSPESLAQSFSLFVHSFLSSNQELRQTMPGTAREFDAYLKGLKLFSRMALENVFFGDKSTDPKHFKPWFVNEARVLNGSDKWGLIQWSTVFAFWLGIVLLLIRTIWLITEIGWRVQAQRHAALTGGFDLPVSRRLSFLASVIQVPMIRMIAAQIAAGANSVRSPESLHDDYAHRMYLRSWIPRFLTWAIPSIGFIGTVVGIGLALLGVGDVMSSDPMKSREALEVISTQLGTAFDTTLVALVTSLVLVLCVHLVQAWEDNALQRALHVALDSVVRPKSPTCKDSGVDRLN